MRRPRGGYVEIGRVIDACGHHATSAARRATASSAAITS